MPHHPTGSHQPTGSRQGVDLATTGSTPFDAAPLYAAARAHRSWSRARCRRRSGVALSLIGILGTAVVVFHALL